MNQSNHPNKCVRDLIEWYVSLVREYKNNQMTEEEMNLLITEVSSQLKDEMTIWYRAYDGAEPADDHEYEQDIR